MRFLLFIVCLFALPLRAEVYDIDPSQPYAPVTKAVSEGIKVPTLEINPNIKAIPQVKKTEKKAQKKSQNKRLGMKARSISAKIKRPQFEWKHEELRPQILNQAPENKPLESIILDALSF
jgi:hypothetical protein